MNPTATGSSEVFAEFVPSGPGLKYSVSICGDMTSKSLAAGTIGEVFGKIGLVGMGRLLVEEEMEWAGNETVFVAVVFAVFTAISVAFVGAVFTVSDAGSANDTRFAMARENRRGGGPPWGK